MKSMAAFIGHLDSSNLMRSSRIFQGRKVGLLSTPSPPSKVLSHDLRAPLPIIVALFALLFPFVSAAQPLHAKQEPSPLPTLTSVKQIRNLKPEEARHGFPVRLRGVVTYYRGSGWELFFQDPTGGIYVQTNKPQPVKTGDAVELTGRTSPGGFT